MATGWYAVDQETSNDGLGGTLDMVFDEDTTGASTMEAIGKSRDL